MLASPVEGVSPEELARRIHEQTGLGAFTEDSPVDEILPAITVRYHRYTMQPVGDLVGMVYAGVDPPGGRRVLEPGGQAQLSSWKKNCLSWQKGRK